MLGSFITGSGKLAPNVSVRLTLNKTNIEPLNRNSLNVKLGSLIQICPTFTFLMTKEITLGLKILCLVDRAS
jgi:hypothetical protein